VVLFSQFIGIALVGTLLYYQFRAFLYRQIHIQLRQTISISELLLDKNKVVSIDLVYLKAFVDGIALILDYRVTIIDQTGGVLADSEVSVDEVSGLENHLNREEVQISSKETWGFSIRRSKTLGRKLIYVSKFIRINPDQHVFLRLSRFAEDTETLLNTARNSFLLGGLLVLFISSVLVIFLTRSMNRTLSNIIESAEKIAGGNLETNINIRSNDELQDLGEILNEMSAELSDSIYKLMRQREDLNTVLSSINDGILAIGPDYKIYFFNQIALRMLELNVSDVTGKHYSDIFLNKHLNSLITRFFENHLYLSDEIELHENKIMRIEINPFRVMETTNIGAVVVLRDVTNFLKLEQIRKEFVANVSHEKPY
jgi:two-component system phosphate regulon sensor histidine kinase PhoR